MTVTLTSADTGEVTVAPSSVVFGPGNYSTAQTITLTAVEDYIADNNKNVNISASSTSLDISYNSVTSSTTVTVVDSGTTLRAPTNLNATGGTTQITLSWTASSGADNYTIYVSTDNSSFTAISPNVSGTSYTHTGLPHSTLTTITSRLITREVLAVIQALFQQLLTRNHS